MTKGQIVWAILLNAVWVIPMIYELGIVPFKDYLKLLKKNKEFVLRNGKQERLVCINCHYCVTFLYRPFYKYGSYRNVMAQKLPKYCRKFRKNLNPEVFLRCIANEYEQVIFKKNTE